MVAGAASRVDARAVDPFIGRRVVAVLALVTAFVALAYLGTQGYGSLVEPMPELERAFNMDAEGTVPTAWNTLLLMSVACTLAMAALLAPARAIPSRRSLFVAAGVVAYLALDEAAALHELGSIPVDALTDRLDLPALTYGWVAIGALVGAFGAIAAWRWARALPAAVRRATAVAIVMYLGGALGVEAINGYLDTNRSSQLRRYVYMLGVAVEESLEMGACVVALAGFSLLLVVRHADGGRALITALPPPRD